ncbi:MAG: hypothetical protein AAFX10_12325 [Pseudomonadota bacterium]
MATFKQTLAGLTLIALTAGFQAPAVAQNLDMRGTEDARQAQGRPSRGMTQASVESTFGAPQSRQSPVGEPPITRWVYADFVVFFEYDRVIHAVARRN